ncbi:MAG: hypothetical protein GC137_06265 [Alphaproteobacteria bacterium]|nr:hypothetical protein [Alphaproteobacteria bacterium]
MRKIILTAIALTFSFPAFANDYGLTKDKFNRLDQNNDGVVTRDEVPDDYKRKFKKLDTNNDGKVTKQEVRKVNARLDNKYSGSEGVEKDRMPSVRLNGLEPNERRRLLRKD